MNQSLFYIVMAVSLISTFMFVIWHNNQKPLFSLMFKVFTSLAFVGVGVFAYYFSNSYSLAGLFVILGLVASLIGDGVLALLEFKLEGQKEKIIICGMVSFSIAQIFYTVALILFSGAYLLWISILGAFLICLAIVFGEKLLKLNYGKTKIWTAVYSFFLALSLLQSLMFAILNGFNDLSLMLFVGFAFFFVSDLILSFIYFSGKDLPKLYYLNYGFYFLAQNLIACALVYFTI